MSLDTLLGLHSQGSQARPRSTMGYLEGLFGDSLQSYLPGGGGQASPAFNPGRSPSDITALARKLERLGFDVGELEGFQGEGQINSGHVANSLHYAGDAMDVNYRGGGRWNNEAAALDWLYRWLNKRYDPQELLWRTDDHYDHLHLGGL